MADRSDQVRQSDRCKRRRRTNRILLVQSDGVMHPDALTQIAEKLDDGKGLPARPSKIEEMRSVLLPKRELRGGPVSLRVRMREKAPKKGNLLPELQACRIAQYFRS